MSDGVVPPVAQEPQPAWYRSTWGLGDVAFGIALSQALAVVATVVVFGIAGWESSADVPLWAGALLQVPLWGGWLAAVFLAGRNKGHGVADDFGWSFRTSDVPLGLLIGVVMQVVVLPILYLPLLRLLGSTPEELSAPAKELTSKAEGTVGWIVLALIVVVGAPIVEELFYRGLFLRALRKRGIPDVWSCVISGAVFGAMHFQPLQFAGLFVLGTVLALLAVRTGRLGLSIVTHMAFNATTVALLYSQR